MVQPMDDAAADTSRAPSAALTWDRLAARYRAQERLELRAIDRALAHAAPARDERIVGLATGTGLVLRRLAMRPRRPREAVGVDRSAGMLARVGPLPEGWSVLQGDARAVALPGGWADVVLCAYLLHLLGPAQRHAVLGEARRLLRPVARSRIVVVTVWTPKRPVAALLRQLARRRPSSRGGLCPHDPSADLADAGFSVTHRIVVPRGGYASLALAATPQRGAR